MVQAGDEEYFQTLYQTKIYQQETLLSLLMVNQLMLYTKHKSSLKLNIAVLGMNLTSKIEGGENEGRTANHEFVVVGFNASVSDNLIWDIKLPELHYSKAKKYALAVWVSEMNNPGPLQVVGGLLPNYKP